MDILNDVSLRRTKPGRGKASLAYKRANASILSLEKGC